jgi:hypothetical protein
MTTFQNEIRPIMTIIFVVMMTLTVPFIMYLGFMLAKAEDEGSRKKAKKRFFNFVSGLVLIVFLTGVLYTPNIFGTIREHDPNYRITINSRTTYATHAEPEDILFLRRIVTNGTEIVKIKHYSITTSPVGVVSHALVNSDPDEPCGGIRFTTVRRPEGRDSVRLNITFRDPNVTGRFVVTLNLEGISNEFRDVQGSDNPNSLVYRFRPTNASGGTSGVFMFNHHSHHSTATHAPVLLSQISDGNEILIQPVLVNENDPSQIIRIEFDNIRLDGIDGGGPFGGISEFTLRRDGSGASSADGRFTGAVIGRKFHEGTNGPQHSAFTGNSAVIRLAITAPRVLGTQNAVGNTNIMHKQFTVINDRVSIENAIPDFFALNTCGKEFTLRRLVDQASGAVINNGVPLQLAAIRNGGRIPQSTNEHGNHYVRFFLCEVGRTIFEVDSTAPSMVANGGQLRLKPEITNIRPGGHLPWHNGIISIEVEVVIGGTQGNHDWGRVDRFTRQLDIIDMMRVDNQGRQMEFINGSLWTP